MMYADWKRYEPDAVRRAVPLEWAFGHLFNVWDMGADMHACPLPGHTDDTPSANLWAEDADGFPIRFGCFGCGANGDVIDLVRIARGVGFLEASRVAVEELIPAMEASGWCPADRTPTDRVVKSPDELLSVLSRLAGWDGDADLATFVRNKGMGGLADYAATTWGWGAFRTPAPVVYFPHWDWDGRMTAIRYRSVRRDTTRWTERGSRFPALYGAWMDQGSPSVLLCEGETDTVWAAWQIANVGRQMDILGLPAGAAQKPPEAAVKRLAMRTVYLAFDADMAGRIAVARWRESLDGVAYRTRRVPIPEGEDVLSCGIPTIDLIQAAE